MNDLKFAIRQLMKTPGFTGIAILTLAVGIGANAVVFSWIRAVLLDAVPGARRANELVALCARHVSGKLTDTMSFLDNRDMAAQTNVFSGVAASCYDAATLRVGNRGDAVWVESATANFFEVLGVQPAAGRFFLPGEDTHPGGDNVAVLGHNFWQRRFGGDSSVIGSTIEVANRSFVVIGVAPPEFNGGMGGLRFDLWIPLTMAPEFGRVEAALAKRDWRFLHTYARLQTGTSVSEAQAAANVVMTGLEREHSGTNKDIGAAVLPVWKSPWGGQAALLPLLRTLGAVSILLLLLVIANIANLLLSRAAARQQEVTVRLALGASRGRLIRQLLKENILLAVLGGGAGCVAAVWGVSLLLKLLPPTPLPLAYNMKLNGPVLLFSAAITLAAGLLFGLAPALQAAKTSLAETLKQGGRAGGQSGRSHSLRHALAVSQIALALILLVSMTLCARSLENARRIDIGLNPEKVWLAGFRLPPDGYDEEQIRDTYRRLRQALTELPGVEAAALADWLPLGFEGGSSAEFSVEGYAPAPGEPMAAGTGTVSPGYFRALNIPILEGREFGAQDEPLAPRVAIINQHLAERYYAGRNPAGLKIRLWGQNLTIVGVAKTGKYRTLNEPAQPFIYVPETQFGDRSLAAIVRTTGNPALIARAVEDAALRVDPVLKPIGALAMSDYTAAAFAVPRMAATLLSALGLAALLLAALGIYGVMSSAVTQRTREIGVRMALGARTLDVLRHFIGQGMRLAVLGMVCGLAGTLASTRLLSSLLIGVTAADPFTYLLAISGLGFVALLACWLPACRAASVDPMTALRRE